MVCLVPAKAKTRNINDLAEVIKKMLLRLPQLRSNELFLLGVEKHANTLAILAVTKMQSKAALVLYGDKILAVPPLRDDKLEPETYVDSLVSSGYDASKIKAIAFSVVDGDTVVTRVYDEDGKLVLTLKTRVEEDKIYVSDTKLIF